MSLNKMGQENMSEDEKGYTLIEVMITVAIMGFILLVVNVVMISIIRISYDTDARIKVRQGLEFTMEVMRRNVKSSDPGMVEKIDWPPPSDPPVPPDRTALRLRVPESEDVLTFFLDPDVELGTGYGVMKAEWVDEAGKSSIVYLTSPNEINVKSFEIDITNDEKSGTSEISLIIEAASAHMRTATEPLVDDIVKQTTIITRYRDL